MKISFTLWQKTEITHNPSNFGPETLGVRSGVFMLMFIQIMIFWFETLNAVLLVNTKVLELPVSSGFRVEVSRVMMWACFIGMNSANILSPLTPP